MSEQNISNLKNKELVEIIGKRIIGTPSGLEAQHAQAELTRRLMDSINSLSRETARYAKVTIFLTILLLAVSLMQLLAFLAGVPENQLARTVLIAIIFGLLALLTGNLTKALGKGL